jgi:methionyl-tRNA formyltransferase
MHAEKSEHRYVVVGNKPWNRRVFDEVISRSYSGEWHFIGSFDELSMEKLGKINPRYIFFLHWSWKVPDDIIANYECVCFHMTDVPYGRGGSPLQNLLIRGHRHTKLTALRMTHDFDAGPVYLQEELCLSGGAEEIYLSATRLSAHMIKSIIDKNLEPVPQTGDVVIFPRRQPAESEIPDLPSLEALHDFIRMLDAAGYPKAFLNYGKYRLEFSRAALYDGRIVADVTISSLKEPREK